MSHLSPHSHKKGALHSPRKTGTGRGNADHRGGGGNASAAVPSCPICLDDIRALAYTSPCIHSYCLTCILAWLEVDAHCPLCKTRIQELMYSVVSDCDYRVLKLHARPQGAGVDFSGRHGIELDRLLHSVAKEERQREDNARPRFFLPPHGQESRNPLLAAAAGNTATTTTTTPAPTTASTTHTSHPPPTTAGGSMCEPGSSTLSPSPPEPTGNECLVWVDLTGGVPDNNNTTTTTTTTASASTNGHAGSSRSMTQVNGAKQGSSSSNGNTSKKGKPPTSLHTLSERWRQHLARASLETQHHQPTAATTTTTTTTTAQPVRPAAPAPGMGGGSRQHAAQLASSSRGSGPARLSIRGTTAGMLSDLRSGISNNLTPATVQERALVYQHRLRASPLVASQYRVTDLNPEHCVNDKRLQRRLEPWIRREVSATIGRGHMLLVTAVVMTALTRTGILSAQAKRDLQPYFHDKVDTFIHELCMFARSPYPMATYDRLVRYQPHGNTVSMPLNTMAIITQRTAGNRHGNGPGASGRSGTDRPRSAPVPTSNSNSNNHAGEKGVLSFGPGFEREGGAPPAPAQGAFRARYYGSLSRGPARVEPPPPAERIPRDPPRSVDKASVARRPSRPIHPESIHDGRDTRRYRSRTRSRSRSRSPRRSYRGGRKRERSYSRSRSRSPRRRRPRSRSRSPVRRRRYHRSRSRSRSRSPPLKSRRGLARSRSRSRSPARARLPESDSTVENELMRLPSEQANARRPQAEQVGDLGSHPTSSQPRIRTRKGKTTSKGKRRKNGPASVRPPFQATGANAHALAASKRRIPTLGSGSEAAAVHLGTIEGSDIDDTDVPQPPPLVSIPVQTSRLRREISDCEKRLEVLHNEMRKRGIASGS